ncbi:MAG: motility protein A, partial [Myxococcota bacterium]
MDLATVIGFVVGLGLIVGSIAIGGSIGAFVDVPSMLIVVGGTLAVTMVMERMENVIGAIKVAKNALFQPAGDVTKTIEVILELSSTARREGLLALEKVTVEDAF